MSLESVVTMLFHRDFTQLHPIRARILTDYIDPLKDGLSKTKPPSLGAKRWAEQDCPQEIRANFLATSSE